MPTSYHIDESGHVATTALLRFIEARGLKVGPLAKRAGFSPSSIYNLTAGRATAPSATLLGKIAEAEGVTIADIMAYASEPEAIAVGYVIISGGRLTLGHNSTTVRRPSTIDPATELEAGIMQADGLYPLPDGWLVFWAKNPRPPEEMIGQLCVVRARGRSDALIGTIQAGRAVGTFDVQPWHGPVIQGLSVTAAHRIEAFQPPG